MKCIVCGSEKILNDYFEEEWVYWCSHCGKEVLKGDDNEDIPK